MIVINHRNLPFTSIGLDALQRGGGRCGGNRKVDVVDGVVEGGALEMAGALDVTATETPEIGVDIADTKLSEV